MQDIKIKNYKRLILSVFIGASLISIMQVTILQVLLTCLICFVVFDFLKKRKQNKLGKCNHFVIECVIVTSFALSEILGNFIGKEFSYLRNKECNSFNAFYEASLCSLTISDDGKSLRITVEF